ncbi:putative HTH-type transcriptional regulator YusO [compost metagenome]
MLKRDQTLELRPEAVAVMDCLRYIFKALRVSSSQFEKQMGLSVAQIFVLKHLQGQETLSINELAEKTVTHQSSVSVVVKKLDEQGLVVRTPSPEDSRKVLVSLSAKGRQLLQTIPRTAEEDMMEALAKMPPEKSQKLAELMKEFAQGAGVLDS